MVIMKIYYKKDISEIIGRPLRTITQWVDSGFIVPDVEDSRGKGKARIFSKSNVVEFAMFNLMSQEMKIKQVEIKYILDHLKGFKTDGFMFWLTHDEIKDFFTDAKWGISKEITYKTKTFYDNEQGTIVIGRGSFHLVEIDSPEDSFYLPQFNQNVTKLLGGKKRENIKETVFWLGSIKNIAVKLLKSKF
jgi:hypothetical protein